jgi:hypothetical protein
MRTLKHFTLNGTSTSILVLYQIEEQNEENFIKVYSAYDEITNITIGEFEHYLEYGVGDNEVEEFLVNETQFCNLILRQQDKTIEDMELFDLIKMAHYFDPRINEFTINILIAE